MTSGTNYNRQHNNINNNKPFSYKFQNTNENQRDQSYRLHIQQTLLQKGEITAHLKHFRLHIAKTTMTRCNSRDITSILQDRVTFTRQNKKQVSKTGATSCISCYITTLIYTYFQCSRQFTRHQQQPK